MDEKVGSQNARKEFSATFESWKAKLVEKSFFVKSWDPENDESPGRNPIEAICEEIENKLVYADSM